MFNEFSHSYIGWIISLAIFHEWKAWSHQYYSVSENHLVMVQQAAIFFQKMFVTIKLRSFEIGESMLVQKPIYTEVWQSDDDTSA